MLIQVLVVVLRLLADKNKKFTMCAFDSLGSLRKTIVEKVVSRLKSVESLEEDLKKKLGDFKKKGEDEMSDWNKSLKAKEKNFFRNEKEANEKKRKKSKPKKKGDGSHSGQDSDEDHEDEDDEEDEEDRESKEDEDGDADLEDENGDPSLIEGSKASSHSESTTLRLGEEEKAKTKKKKEKKAQKQKEDDGKKRKVDALKTPAPKGKPGQRKDDADLWGDRFTPSNEKSKEEPAEVGVSDELIEMLTSPMQECFKKPHVSQLETRNVL